MAPEQMMKDEERVLFMIKCAKGMNVCVQVYKCLHIFRQSIVPTSFYLA